MKLCLQAAEGLRYLHDPNGAHHKLIHRDIKSGNILLDEKWNVKIADLGLSEISPDNANLVTVVRGTPGYTDPEYYKTYTLTEKSDVYSFGVTLFEVLCGRLCYDIKGCNELLVYVHNWMKIYEEKKIEDIIFKELDMKQIDESSLKLFSDIAYKCLNESREERPRMAEVVSKLKAALQFQFEQRSIYLLVAGFEFQPSEEKVSTLLLSMVMLFIKDIKKKCIIAWICHYIGGTSSV